MKKVEMILSVLMALALLAAIAAGPCGAAVVYVSKSGNDGNDGSSWEDAKLTIAAGLGVASSGDEVWVAEGTYQETITVPSNVALYGGFDGDETARDQRNWQTNVTTIDGNAGGSVVTISSDAGSGTIIDGFTITDGSATTGGGVNFQGAAYATISHNTIEDNSASGAGGGIYCAGSPKIRENVIVGNDAAYGGGAIMVVPNSSPEITNNTILDNSATSGCGGITCVMASPVIASNIIAFNSSGIYNSSGSPTLSHNDVYDNDSYDYSGCSAGSGDISDDPLFETGSYHLTKTSPCINSGDDNYGPATEQDYYGEPRRVVVLQGDHQVDIGADEFGVIIHVSKSGNDGNGGLSWGGAKLTIAEGLDTADEGDEVWVAEGTYGESITAKSNVALYGGFYGDEDERSERNWLANETTIDGTTTTVTIPSGVDSYTVVDGFTITGGSSNIAGGILCQGPAIISHNLITDNSGNYGAGGIHCSAGSPKIRENVIAGNSAGYLGGAILVVTDCSPEITNNTIVDNSAGAGGGGIYCAPNSSPVIASNIIAFNSSGIYNYSGGNPTLSHNDVYGNDSYDYSGVSAGTGDISSDPLLADWENGDYHLTFGSPCIDYGYYNYGSSSEMDIDGQDRQVDIPDVGDHTLDIGADEFVDDTAPSTPSVNDGTSTDIDVQSSLTQLSANWSSTDDESGIVQYKYAIGTSATDPKVGYVVPWTSTGTTPSVTKSSLSLTEGYTYYVYVKAKNGVGNWSDAGVSDGITVGSSYAAVERDLIGGWGSFDYGIGYHEWAGFTGGGCGDHGLNPTAMGVGWWRFIGIYGGNYTCEDVREHITSELVTHDSRTCQYLALVGPITSYDSSVGMDTRELPVYDDKPYAIHHGDTLRFEIGYMDLVPNNLSLTYKIYLYYKSDPDSNGDTDEAAGTPVEISGTSGYLEQVVPETVPGHELPVAHVKATIQVCRTGNIEDSLEHGLYLDDAQLHIKRSGESNYEQEIVPAPRNRNFTTTMQPCVYGQDNYTIARDYDVVLYGAWTAAEVARLKYYNPNLKAYLHLTGGGIGDYREEEEVDSWCQEPLKFWDVLSNHPEWLYEYDVPSPDPRQVADPDIPEWKLIDYLFDHYYLNIYYLVKSNTDMQDEWIDGAVDAAELYRADGIFLDGTGAWAEIPSTPDDEPPYYLYISEPWEAQQFLHAIVPEINLPIMQNMSEVNLVSGGPNVTSANWYSWWPEAGLIYFDPNWETNNNYPTPNYSNNSVTNTPKENYQERAFFTNGGTPDHNCYNVTYWEACLDDMDTVATWNGSLQEADRKKTNFQLRGVDRPDDGDPAAGLDGWINFGLCSFLLGKNDYTTLGAGIVGEDTGYTESFTEQIHVANNLGDPTDTRDNLTGNVWAREFDNGIVVVNGDPDDSDSFTLEDDVWEEGTGTFYEAESEITLQPHTGRIFFYDDPNP